jgi:hypothetical protein
MSIFDFPFNSSVDLLIDQQLPWPFHQTFRSGFDRQFHLPSASAGEKLDIKWLFWSSFRLIHKHSPVTFISVVWNPQMAD